MLRQAKRRKKRRIVLWASLAGAVLFFIILRFNLFPPLSSFFNTLASPFWKVEKAIGEKISSRVSISRSKKSLLEQNKLLKERLGEYEMELLYKDILFDENKELKEILQRSEDLAFPEGGFILGVILAKPNQSPYDSVVIDIGRRDGVKEGDLVFAKGDILLGQLDEISKKTSRIKLFSTPGEKLDVVISDSNIYITLYGRGGGNFEMALPRDVEITKGTEVVLPGITPYLVAIVQKINYDPRDPMQKILLTSPVNVQNLKFVEVLKQNRIDEI